MDPKVKEILSKARASAVSYGKAAGKFAGSMVEQAKINLQIFDLNTEVEVAYKEIGKLVYAVHAGEEVCNEAVQSQIEKIDSKLEQIAELKDRLAGIKTAEPQEEIVVCEAEPVCTCEEPAPAAECCCEEAAPCEETAAEPACECCCEEPCTCECTCECAEKVEEENTAE